MSDGMMSTGYIKIGNAYVNPHNISSIERAENPRDAKISYNVADKDVSSIIAYETKPDKVAQAAIQAMKTGEIFDVYA